MKTQIASNLIWLTTILTLGLQVSACAPTESKRSESVSATSDGSGEYRVEYDAAGQCGAYVLKFAQGQVTGTLYYFYHCSTVNMYDAAHLRKKIGTYSFNGTSYAITWSYETCSPVGSETVAVVGTKIAAQVRGALTNLDRLDGYSAYIGRGGIYGGADDEDLGCNLIP